MADKGADRRRWMLDAVERQAHVVDALVDQAHRSPDPADACLHWLGAERQAQRYLRNARPRPAIAERLTEHRAALGDASDLAQSHLAEADAAVVAAARSRLGLRIAVVGKGGAGKSLISGTLARLLARRGRRVLAADLDTNPGLAFSLGVPATEGALPPAVLEEHPGASYGWRLRSGVTPAEAVEAHALAAPDGVRFMSLGKLGDPKWGATQGPRDTVVAMRELIAGFGEPGWDVIGDQEAGPTTPFERYHAFAEQVAIVVTPTWVSAMTARRLLPMVDDVDTVFVGNQFRDEPDHPGMTPLVRIPIDPAVADAERRGLAPLDACPDSPTIAAIARLADTLTNQEVTCSPSSPA
ncbi:MAG: hypothetical protein WD250_09345 [Egibacteraceae bacterium]